MLERDETTELRLDVLASGIRMSSRKGIDSHHPHECFRGCLVQGIYRGHSSLHDVGSEVEEFE